MNHTTYAHLLNRATLVRSYFEGYAPNTLNAIRDHIEELWNGLYELSEGDPVFHYSVDALQLWAEGEETFCLRYLYGAARHVEDRVRTLHSITRPVQRHDYDT